MEAPPVIAIPAPQPRSMWWLTAGLLAAAIAAVLYIFNPSQYGFYPRCALYVTTGIYCPGCGSLRAMHQLTHGHLLAAMHDNLFLVASLPFAAFYAWKCVRRQITGKPWPRLFFSTRTIVILGFALTLFTILRNIRCAPFTWLAPL